jgi:N-methylhydantoinase B
MTVHSAVGVETQPTTRVNPVTGAIIFGALENIAIEMGHKLMRMAYSSISALRLLTRREASFASAR